MKAFGRPQQVDDVYLSPGCGQPSLVAADHTG
jgi:hypothetical protein